jgi:hypothetical protein
MTTIADTVLDNCAPAIRPLARAIFTELHERFPDAVVTADADSIGLGTGPGYKYLVFTILPYTKHVSIGFAHGATLPDPAGLLEGTGKVHRHVKIRTDDDLMRPELATLWTTALTRAR